MNDILFNVLGVMGAFLLIFGVYCLLLGSIKEAWLDVKSLFKWDDEK